MSFPMANHQEQQERQADLLRDSTSRRRAHDPALDGKKAVPAVGIGTGKRFRIARLMLITATRKAYGTALLRGLADRHADRRGPMLEEG
jgi:hypothetical protein